MDHLPIVGSRMFLSAGFADGRIEFVLFRGGLVYGCAATADEFDAFMAARSKGQHFQQVFRSRCTIVPPGTPERRDIETSEQADA